MRTCIGGPSIVTGAASHHGGSCPQSPLHNLQPALWSGSWLGSSMAARCVTAPVHKATPAALWAAAHMLTLLKQHAVHTTKAKTQTLK